MKKLMITAAAALCATAAAYADGVESGIVGYQTVDAPAAGNYIALAVQFEGIGESATLPIASLVKVGAPKGAKSIADGADQIWIWDSANADWVKYFYRSTNSKWCKQGEQEETGATVKNGDTVFFYRGGGGTVTTLTLSGGVSPVAGKPEYTNLVAGNFYMMAYPWPVAMSIKTFKNYQGAPKGAKSLADGADQIWRWNTTNNDWDKYFYRSTNGAWCKQGETAETSHSIPAGEGFFFYRGGGGATDTVTFEFAAE